VQGPFEVEKLKLLARRGRFAVYDDVSEDRANWIRVSSHPTLAAEVFQSRVDRKVRAIDAIAPEPDDVEVEYIEEESETYGLADDAGAQGSDQMWHYTLGGDTLGPVDVPTLQRLISLGEVGADVLVWTDGMSDWRPVNQLPNLFQTPIADEFSDPVDSHQRKRRRHEDDEVPRTSAMAVTSLILSILGTNLLFFLGSVIGVVFGHLALREIDDSDGRIAGRAMAVTGLVLGYAVMLFTVVTGIVFVVLTSQAIQELQ
jgi:hypothetical protein